MKLRVKEPIHTERGELAGSGNYGPYGAGEVFDLPDAEAERELQICGHALERYEDFERRSQLEKLKEMSTRQQADDLARLQSELQEAARAELRLRQSVVENRFKRAESVGTSSPEVDLEKEELRKRIENQDRTISDLKAMVESLLKPKETPAPSISTSGSKKKHVGEHLKPDEGK